MKSDNDTFDDEFDELEALIAKKIGRGRGKYKGNLPIIYFSCNKVGHITARCPDREDKDERKESKYKGKRDDQDYKKNKDDKCNKSCYIVEEESDIEFVSNDDEVSMLLRKKILKKMIKIL